MCMQININELVGIKTLIFACLAPMEAHWGPGEGNDRKRVGAGGGDGVMTPAKAVATAGPSVCAFR